MPNFGFGFPFKSVLFGGGFNPLTDINGLSLYLNKNTNVNTKIAADFVAANSEYLSSASTDFDKTDSDFSGGGWFKIDSYSGDAHLMSKYNATGNQRSFLLWARASDSTLRIIMSSDGSTTTGVVSSSTISLGSWIFIVWVHDSVNDLIKISTNGGDFVTGAHSGGVLNSTADFELASSSGGSGFTDGQADAPFFYDKALSLAEVNALYNLGNGTSYPSLEDLNGNTYAIGQALSGADAFNIDAVLTPLAATTEGYWEMYYTPTTALRFEYLMSFGDTSAATHISLFKSGAGKLVIYCINATVVQFSITTDAVVFSDNTQEKLSVKFDGVLPILYIDDIAVAQTLTTSVDTTVFLNDIPLIDNVRLGCNSIASAGNASFVLGKIQNLKIWSDATQTTQVADYLLNNVEGADQVDTIGAYNGTPIGTPVSTIASVANTTIATIESSLVSWWDLNESSGTRIDAVTASGNDLTQSGGVGYALGKVQDTSTVGERVWNWIDQSSNAYIFANDTVTEQPLLESGSIAFDGTDDILKKIISGVYSGDSSGIIFFSGYFDNSLANWLLTSCHSASTNEIFSISITITGEISINGKTGGVNNVCYSTDTIANGAFYYGHIKSNGTTWTMNLNGVDQVVVVVAGSNNGNWFADSSSRSNLVVGARQFSSTTYSPAKLNKIIYSNDYTIDTAPILNFMSNPDN